jgi:biotin carboxyl carrier protein
MKYDILINLSNGEGARHSVEFTPPAADSSRCSATIDGRRVDADAVTISPGLYSIVIEGYSLEVRVEAAPDGLLVHSANREYCVEILDPRSWRRGRAGKIEPEGRQKIVASMPGKIVRLLVTLGQQVEAGQGLLVVEAMKMQNEIHSPKSGTVERLVQEGQTVNAGEVLAIVT